MSRSAAEPAGATDPGATAGDDPDAATDDDPDAAAGADPDEPTAAGGGGVGAGALRHTTRGRSSGLNEIPSSRHLAVSQSNRRRNSSLSSSKSIRRRLVSAIS